MIRRRVRLLHPRWSRPQHPGSVRGRDLRAATQATAEWQAIARAPRMGQVQSVQVHRLLSERGVDQGVTEILARKRELFDEFARVSETADSAPKHSTSPRPTWPETSSQLSASGFSHGPRGTQRRTRKPSEGRESA